jgi:alpha-N-acetylglucosamine transferase
MTHAYVTMVDDNYLPGVLALKKSLVLTDTYYPLIAMYTNLSDRSIEILESYNIQLKKVNFIPNQNSKNRFSNTYTKLNIFSLIEYKSIIFLDADIIVLKNIDCLLSLPTFSASPDWGKRLVSNRFNSGLLVIQPDQSTYLDMIKNIDSISSYDGSDQGFLNNYFKNYHKLDFTYNVLKRIYKYHKNLWQNSILDIKVLHFVGHKPWMPQSKHPFEQGYEQLIDIWKKYEQYY